MVLLASVLTAAAPAAFPEPPKTRQAALAALKSADAAARAEAVVWIANLGEPADAALLQERLRDESLFVRTYAERALWLLWSRSGDAEVDQLMAQGVEEMQAGDNQAAIATFSKAIARKPAFAEAWNKRATVYYVAGDLRRSIADCHEVLKRNPGHFGALSGMGEIHLGMDQPEEALLWFRKAFAANPNLLGVEMRIKQLEQHLEAKRGRTT